MKTLCLILLVFLTVLACKENSLTGEIKSKSNPLSYRTEWGYSDSGDLHNSGLDYAKNLEYDWDEMDEQEVIDSVTAITDRYATNELEIELSGPELSHLEDLLNTIFDDPTFSDLTDTLNDYRTVLTNLTALTNSEESLLTRLKNLTSGSYLGLSNHQIALRIIDSLEMYDDLIKYNPTLYPRKECLGAAVRLSLGSVNYWDEVNGDLPGGLPGPVQGWVQVDCVGYLIGWAKAWWGEQGPGYSNSDEAQQRRIGKGIETGLQMSMGNMAGKGSW